MVSAGDGTILLGGSKNRCAFGELKAVLDKHSNDIREVLDKHSNEIQEIKGVLKKDHQIGKKNIQKNHKNKSKTLFNKNEKPGTKKWKISQKGLFLKLRF